MSSPVKDDLNHLVADTNRVRETRLEVSLSALEALLVITEASIIDTFRPSLHDGKIFSESNECDRRPTRAAIVNSKSSIRKDESSTAVLMVSSRSWGFRKRYSLTPNHRRKSWRIK